MKYKIFVAILVIMHGLAYLSESRAGNIFVFDTDINLPESCTLFVGASINDSYLIHSCGRSSVSFYNIEKDSGDVYKEKFSESYARGVYNKLIHTRFILGSPNLPAVLVYIICDDELCMRIMSVSDEFITKIVMQVGEEMLHDKSIEKK